MASAVQNTPQDILNSTRAVTGLKTPSLSLLSAVTLRRMLHDEPVCGAAQMLSGRRWLVGPSNLQPCQRTLCVAAPELTTANERSI